MTWKLQDFKADDSENIKALVLSMPIAKRCKKKEGKEYLTYKEIALPCNPSFEPWTMDLLKWIQKNQAKEDSLRFQVTRNTVRSTVIKHLYNLNPQVHCHSLRHWRLTHLVTYYNFDPYDLTQYAGWTFVGAFGKGQGASGMLDSYINLSWKRYFPKLLRSIETFF